MAIIETLTKDSFISRFREIRPDEFSYEGLKVLYDFFDEMSEEKDIEFDPIAICCDFSELDEESAMVDYGYLFDKYEIEQDKRDFKELIEILQDETLVLVLENGSIIIQAF